MSLFGIKYPSIKAPSLRPLGTAAAVPFGLQGEAVASLAGGRGIFSPDPKGGSGRGLVAGIMYDLNSQARAKALADITKGDFDAVTKSELFTAYQDGMSGGNLASLLHTAKEGKGIYAVRRINEAGQKALANEPGRRQLSANYGIL